MTRHQDLPTWHQARARAADSVDRPMPAERIPLASADGRVLADDLTARTDLPPYPTSAMDGWAVAGSGTWRVVGQVLAGHPATEELAPGTAVVIATGAVIPPGTSAVVRSENGSTSRDAAGVETLHAEDPEPDKEIRPAALECEADEVLATAGSVLTPGVIGLLAAAGHDDLPVRVRPRAAVLIFGDELLDSGLPDAGRVRDSLGPQLPAWLRRLGAVPDQPVRVADVASAHTEAIRSALGAAEIVVTTGGTAAGPVDHLHTAIAELGGRLVVDSVASRPGHPMLMATFETAAGPRWLLGLPGNPQSAVVALLTLGQPVVRRLLGAPVADLGPVTVTSDIRAPRGENRLVPGRLTEAGFTVSKYLGSAMLRGLAAADGFAVLPQGGVSAGQQAEWLPLP